MSGLSQMPSEYQSLSFILYTVSVLACAHRAHTHTQMAVCCGQNPEQCQISRIMLRIPQHTYLYTCMSCMTDLNFIDNLKLCVCLIYFFNQSATRTHQQKKEMVSKASTADDKTIYFMHTQRECIYSNTYRTEVYLWHC